MVLKHVYEGSRGKNESMGFKISGCDTAEALNFLVSDKKTNDGEGGATAFVKNAEEQKKRSSCDLPDSGSSHFEYSFISLFMMLDLSMFER
jgi:hypothetical protein